MFKQGVMLASLMLFACGDDDGENPPPDPDAPLPVTNEVTVEIHRDFPFIDGDTADEAEFVAVQDGDGAFVQATGTNGVFKVTIESDRFGIAVGCRDVEGGFVTIEIAQQTVADGLTYATVCKSRPANATLDITVANLPADHQLRLRTRNAITTSFVDGTVTLDVPAGDTELFGVLTDANRNVVRMFRIPSIQVAGATAITIDAVADGAPPDLAGVFGVTPDDPAATIRTSVVRPYGTLSLTGFSDITGGERNYLRLPTALQQPDDLYRFTVSGQTGSASRTAKTPGTLAFELPADFTAPNPELLETPFLHPVWSFTPTAAMLPNQSYFLDVGNFSDFTAPVLRFWFVTLSASWVGDAPVRYEFPDLSGMPGFANLALVPNERLDTTISRFESTAAANIDGATSTSSTASGVIGKFCGDGAVIAPETCDPGELGETDVCDVDCTAAECGDTVVNFSAGEDCDPPDGKTCSKTCTFLF